MNCQEFDEIADSYLSDELLVETNHGLIRHLESCSDCRNALGERRELRTRLRSVVRSSSEIDPAFVRRVRSQIRNMATPVSSRSFVPAFAFAAMLIVGLLGLVIYLQPSLLPSLQSAKQNVSLTAALHDAVGTHKDCGLKYARDEAEQITNERDFASLKAEFTDKLELVEKHDCTFFGKTYTHTILRNGAKLISILKTASASDADSGVIVSTPIDNFQIAEFESSSHSVFVISDLSEAENLQVARVIFNNV
ncbi:MAG: anti-sigma factor family protein [Pyrinomonadaceae bacterium]